jgi:hypothetical protein
MDIDYNGAQVRFKANPLPLRVSGGSGVQELLKTGVNFELMPGQIYSRWDRIDFAGSPTKSD